MTGGTNIRAVGPEDAHAAPDETVSEDNTEVCVEEDAYDEYWEEDTPSRNWMRLIWPTLATLAILGWTGFYGWAHHQDMLTGSTLQQWTAWITAWAVPVLLITSAWLLIMRNSSREAERFGVIAQTLSTEAATLEERLSTINRELSLAREFLGSQSRELDSLGRIATERLTDHANNLQALVQSNGDQIDAIASVSTTALENMGKLRDDLPVIANSAKDVSNQIGTAGMTAHTQIAELIAGFERLNQFGKASENQVDSIQTKIDVALTSFEARTSELEELTDTRFGALTEKSEAFRADLDGREVEALAAMRRRAEALEDEFSQTRENLEHQEEEALKSLRARLAALHQEAGVISTAVQDGEDAALILWNERIETLKTRLTSAIEDIQKVDEQALASANRKLEALRQEAETVDANIAKRDAEFAEQIDLRRTTFAENEAEALSKLEERFALLDTEMTARRETQLADAEALARRSEAIAERIGSLKALLEDVSAAADVTQSNTTERAEQIAATLGSTQQSLEGTNSVVEELTEACVRLLELIQASAQHSQVDLPEALGSAEARLSEVKAEAEALDGIVGQTVGKADTLSSYVIKAQETERETLSELEELGSRLEQSHDVALERMATLKSDLASVNTESELLSGKAQDQLRAAIKALEDAAKSAPATLEAELAGSVSKLAGNIAKETGAALDRTLETATRESIGKLETAVTEANNLGRETTVQLRDQLAKVNELAGNLETRVSRAREQAEEQVNNDFARRMALLTESLNSNAIDIAKAMSADVTDTAWASYLKGDRGIFTRRAVRLLDNTEARDIAEIYDTDYEFRENVSRYIHDFEAMLRSMLSTRDGNALGVTILSSDMGKLYVALAQSIERLRD